MGEFDDVEKELSCPSLEQITTNQTSQQAATYTVQVRNRTGHSTTQVQALQQFQHTHSLLISSERMHELRRLLTCVPPLEMTKLSESMVSIRAPARLIVPRHVCAISASFLQTQDVTNTRGTKTPVQRVRQVTHVIFLEN